MEREEIHDRLPVLWHNKLRLVRLANGLRVLLSENPDADTCACTMTVRCGSFADPEDLPGLAHFCEHMLFLGTEKYPDEGDFETFLAAHRGTHNAGTGSERTSYFFSVLPAGFAGALERFAQFFVAPLFTESATEREINAINSEHEKNVPDEQRRTYAVVRTACVPGHPCGKFPTGCTATLGARPLPELRAALLALFDRYYTPRNMVLALEGPLALDALERLAAVHFGAVPVRAGGDGRGAPPPMPTEAPALPFPADAEGRTHLLLRAVPLTPQRAVTVLWQVADDLRRARGQDAMNYVADLLGHESEGSVLALLKARGWATALSAGLEVRYESFYTVSCTVQLTPAGYAHWADVVAAVYAYVGMLRAHGPSRAHFDEQSTIDDINYTYEARTGPLVNTRMAARFLADGTPVQELFSHGALLLTFDAARIGAVLAHMRPDNAVTFLAAPELAPECPDTERWYGVRYARAQPVPDALLARWRAAFATGDLGDAQGEAKDDGQDETLHMPDANPFVPTREGCRVLGPLDEAIDATPPARVFADAQCTCFWKQDRTFGEPRVYLRVLLASRHARSTLKESCCAAVLSCMLTHALNRFSYMAELAGIDGTFFVNPRGLVLSVDGLCEKLSVYAVRALRELRAFAPDAALFEMVRTRILETVQDWCNDSAYAQGYRLASYCGYDAYMYPVVAYEDVLPTLTVQDVADWLQTYFERGVRIVTFFEGNLTKERAVELTGLFQSTLALPVAPPAELLNNHPTEIPRGRTTLDLPRLGDDTNSAVVVLRTSRHRTTADEDLNTVYAMLAANLVQAPFFGTLRTQQQLGYVVLSSCASETYRDGVCFVVQSSTHAPDALSRHIDAFLAQTPALAERLSDADFAAAVDALVKSLEIKPKTLKADAEDNWPAVQQGTLAFAQWKGTIELCRQCTREGLAEYVRTHLVPGGAEEREFAVRIWGQYKSQAELDAARAHNADTPAVHFTSLKDVFAHNVFKSVPVYHKVLEI